MGLTRRNLLKSTALALTLPMPFIRQGAAAEAVVPKGKMTLAWHSNIASRWLDPQQHDGTATPDNFLFANHDALIKNFRDEKYEHLALAESFDFAEDGKSATFQLRAGLKFHDGSPVTPEDVRWSYEHYTGASATLLHEKTHAIDIVNDRTVKFSFKEPFLDFPILIGTANVCGAGWVVPAKYHQKVGKDGFVQKPIGAGPYKLVSQQAGNKIEYEAFEDYSRPVHVKNFTIVSVPEAATRVAMLERGEADIAYGIPGELIDRIKNNPKVTLAPVVSGSWWLEFPDFNNPKNPFHDKRVREAVSLTVDRKAINDAESGGMGRVSGNWINDDVEYVIDWPKWETNIPKAKELMKQAGHPDGFKVDWLTAVPNYFSRRERVVSQLKAIGIQTRLQTMERGVYLKRMESGLKEWPGVQIIMNATRMGGSWSNWYDGMFRCGGFQSKDMICVQALDDKFTKYATTFNRAERQKIAEEIQKIILKDYYFVPIFRHAYPWEDIELKETSAAQK